MRAISARRAEAIQKELEQHAVYAREADERAGIEPMPAPEPSDAEPEPEPPAPEPLPAAPAQPPPQEAQAQPERVRPIQLPDGNVVYVNDTQFEQLARDGIIARTALAQQPRQAAPAPAAPQPLSVQLADEEVDKFVKQLQYGSADDAKAALKEYAQALARQLQPAIPDQQRLLEAARAEALRVHQEQQLQRDLAVIAQEYPDLWGKRQLADLAAIELTHLRHEDRVHGRNRSELDAYREACNRVYDTLGKPRPGTEPKSPATQAAVLPSLPAKEDRKRAAPRQPAAANLRAPAQEAPRPPTGSEIVANMRRARGQQLYT